MPKELKPGFDSAPSRLSEFGQSRLICLKSHTRSHKSLRIRSFSFGQTSRRVRSSASLNRDSEMRFERDPLFARAL